MEPGPQRRVLLERFRLAGQRDEDTLSDFLRQQIIARAPSRAGHDHSRVALQKGPKGRVGAGLCVGVQQCVIVFGLGPFGFIGHIVESLVQPFGTLWFIYILPIFFTVTRWLKGLPVWFVLVWAAALEMLPVHTGSVIFDEFCARYVYFFAGYALATRIFDLADRVAAHRGRAVAALAGWALINGWLVFTPAPSALALLQSGGGGGAGLASLPGISLALGIAGAMAIITVSALVASAPWSRWLSWLGAHSIVVYLAFFLPMAITRTVLIKTGIVTDIGTVSLLVTAAGVIGPVVLYGLVQWSGRGRFLFERPAWAIIDRRPVKREGIVPAE